MKSILYSVCIGSLALALTAGGAQAARDKRSDNAKPQQRSAKVQAARPANTGRSMSAHRNVSAAQYRQRSYANPHTSSNAMVEHDTGLRAVRERNLARNERMRERNFQRKQDFRARRDVAANRDRNVAVNRTGNAAYYRRGNVTITNNWRGDAFRGQRYAAFRNYNRQWHDRSWWRSHYDRIIFVNNGWYYWNAGYWFPAWGYAPSVSYVYDGPIYAYNGWTPDRVTVGVQEQLARAGYYDGPIDGVLVPMTREATVSFQPGAVSAVASALD